MRLTAPSIVAAASAAFAPSAGALTRIDAYDAIHASFILVLPWSVVYDDLNNDGLFEINELVEFSGVATSMIGSSSTYLQLVGTPDIPGVSAYSLAPGITGTCSSTTWCRKGLSQTYLYPTTITTVDPDLISPISSIAYSYTVTQLPAVPEPSSAALLLLGGAFGAAVMQRRRNPARLD